jgi:hypothetical protein
MARTYSFSPSLKSFSASSTTTAIWSPAEIDSAGCVAFHIAMNTTGGTASTINLITRVRVKANGQTVVDCTLDELRAYQERFSPKGNSDDTDGLFLNIPLNSLDARSDDEGDRCQFMPGASATVEVVIVTGAGQAGTLMLGWTKTTVAPEFFMTLIESNTNVAASTTNGRSPLSGPGFVQGLGLPTQGLNRFRAILSGLEVANIPGSVYNGATAGALGDLLVAMQSLYENPDTATDTETYQFIKLNQGLEANPATSWLELTTQSNWGTASASTAQTLYTLVPVQPQRA